MSPASLERTSVLDSARTAEAISSPDAPPSDRPSSASEADRSFPLLHPRPAKGWLNDPNGLCYRNGRFHVFFQHNPESARHHRICWGHVSSANLLTWREEPVALCPQPDGPDAFGCWSGVMADDDGVPTAVYSGVQDSNGRSQVTLARGSENLRDWPEERVVAAPMPADSQITAVRDPFLFEFNGGRYAVQGAGLADGRPALLLYRVQDLRAWEYLGIWLTGWDAVAAEHAGANIWECPQIIELDGRWMAVLSLWKLRDEHHHLSGVAYLVGNLKEEDGAPVFVPEAGGHADDGPDFYAPQALALADRTLLWGWSWESRSEEESDAAGWSGLLTFPRELGLAGDQLVVRPARELSGHRRRPLESGTVPEDQAAPGPSVQVFALPDAAEALVGGDAGAAGTAAAGDAVDAVRDAGTEVELSLVSASGRRAIHTETLAEGTGLRIFVDGSIVEVYRSASVAATLRAYPAEGETWQLRVTSAASAAAAEVSCWELGR